MWRHRASIAREGSNELGVCFTDMGCPALPGKSRGAVHKRATAIRRHQPALILPAAGMTLFPTMSRFSHSAALAALIASAGLLVGCGQGQKQAAAPPAKVTVATPVKRTIVDQDEYVGRFVAVDSVEIRSRVSGYLDQVHFQDGQMVKQGDLLFTIDKRPFQNTVAQARGTLAQAKANLAFAEADLERAKQLVRDRTITEQTFDQRTQAQRSAAASVAATEAAVRQAELAPAFTEP